MSSSEIGERLGRRDYANLPVDAVQIPALSFERERRKIPKFKEGAETNELALARYEREAIEWQEEVVRVYEAERIPFRVVIPEHYAAQLDRICQLKQQAESAGNDGEKARLEMESDELAELEDRMTVDDAFRHALMTPYPGLFREIVILPHANPYDGWYRLRLGAKDLCSAAETEFRVGRTSWFKSNRGVLLVENTMHEWAHLFDEHHPIAARIARLGLQIDAPKIRKYGDAPRERIAIVLGEYALSPEGHRVADLVEHSPVTALAIAEGLLDLLSRVPKDQASALEKELTDRALRMKAESGTVATRTLIESIQSDPGSDEANDAFRAILFLGQAGDLRELTDLRSVNLSYELLSDSIGRKVGEVPLITDVDLSYTFIGPETLQALSRHPLETANLSGTQVSNASMCMLPLSLRTLDLSCAKGIGDGALPNLLRLNNLERLDVSRTNISRSGIEKLRAGLPKVDILHD